jgi:hypothetical protein
MRNTAPASCHFAASRKPYYEQSQQQLKGLCKNEETHLALDSYHVAILTHNPVLLACSDSIVQQIAGPDIVSQVFGQNVMPSQSNSGDNLGATLGAKMRLQS